MELLRWPLTITLPIEGFVMKISEKIQDESKPRLHFQLGNLSDTFLVRFMAISEYFKKEAIRSGVDTRPGFVSSLAAIQKNPGLSQTELSLLTQRDQSLIANMLSIMIADGLVTRKRSAIDRRRHELYISPTGQDALERFLSMVEDLDERLLQNMSPNAVALLRELLEAARLSCDKAGGD